MADDFPVAVLANDHPGDFHRQRLGIRLDDKGRRARDVDQVASHLRRPDVAELHSRRRPPRQAGEIGRNAIMTTVEIRVRSEEERIPRIERCERLRVELAERGRPFPHDAGDNVVSRAAFG